MALLQFVLVMAVTPARFWRHGVRTGENGGLPTYTGIEFGADWKPFQIGDAPDLTAAIPVVDQATVTEWTDKWKRELAVKPASQEEVDAYLKQLADAKGQDKDQIIADLQAKNADYEARLMKLELAATGGDKSGKKSGADQPKG
jgi:hypothetical protein